jgi:MATE family multidrug resistance protein
MRPITHTRVLAIALPVVLSNVTVPILGAVDTGVIGQLGNAAAIGAVGIGAIVLNAIFWMFGFLRMGTTGFAAQAVGAGDARELAAIFARVLVFGVVVGCMLILIQGLLFTGAFMISPASTEVERLARLYLEIRIYSAPAVIAVYGLSGWLIGTERTRDVFIIQFGMNAANIVLDLWFVLGLGAGIEGVACATLIAEWGGLLTALFLCRATLRNAQTWIWPHIMDRVKLLKMTVVNRDILLRSLMLQIMFVSFLLIGSDFDDDTLAANQVLLQFISITAYGMDGFAFTVEALVGQAVGARSIVRLREAVIKCGQWGVAVGLLGAVAFWLFGGQIIDTMAKVETVQVMARVYLPYMVFVPIIGVFPWMLDGIFIGATRGPDMRNMMAVSLIVYLAALMILLPNFGNHGLWIAFLISFAARGLTLVLRYPQIEKDIRALDAYAIK